MKSLLMLIGLFAFLSSTSVLAAGVKKPVRLNIKCNDGNTQEKMVIRSTQDGVSTVTIGERVVANGVALFGDRNRAIGSAQVALVAGDFNIAILGEELDSAYQNNLSINGSIITARVIGWTQSDFSSREKIYSCAGTVNFSNSY